MRRTTVAAAVFAFSLYVSAQSVQAHGPGGGHQSGGQAHIAASATPGNGFRGGDFSGLPGGGQLHHKPDGGPAGGGSGKPRPNVTQLHSPTTNGINRSSSTSSSGGNGGTTSGSTS